MTQLHKYHFSNSVFQYSQYRTMGKFTFFFLVFTLFLSNFVASSLGKKQGDVLSKFYKAKQKNSAFRKSYLNDENVELDKVILPQEGSKAKDWINKLPGQPPVKFQQYGGYVTVNQSAGRALYYYFTEAENSEALPLLLWLNGGPGCSSMAYGAMEELGPFRVNSDGKTLHRNSYAWNRAANVLFLESPAGVGFSYTNTSSDFNTTGDSTTANDNVVFLLNWLERFPEYKKRDFYISGESYAGHYVPQLAHEILKHNKQANRTLINLKGIIIGNAVINDDTDIIGMYEYFASHALISDETYHDIQNSCFVENYNESKCNSAIAISDNNINYLDIYNIYFPLCKNGNLTKHPKIPPPLQIDPCSADYIYAYLNRRDVQDALHANVTNIKYEWESCSNTLFYNWKDSSVTIVPLLIESLENGVRVWIFSGDTDGRVPVTSSKRSIQAMNLTVDQPWRSWLNGGEVGGYVETYKGGLTFATVRGAGHEVPSYQPARALSLISHFLSGTLPPGDH
ncbi:serine carboxypeptidase-like 40 [Solanum lycopersicum]|uniref:serine carboxypeptidase-like 40 n=1 Tax=Solanum lycopersicum TaxID=4081 RepID=UPI000E1C883C|nr:serine carboxypeptidase-like 40 [Solanum lycopersicum]